jgi:hypothetical protein
MDWHSESWSCTYPNLEDLLARDIGVNTAAARTWILILAGFTAGAATAWGQSAPNTRQGRLQQIGSSTQPLAPASRGPAVANRLAPQGRAVPGAIRPVTASPAPMASPVPSRPTNQQGRLALSSNRPSGPAAQVASRPPLSNSANRQGRLAPGGNAPLARTGSTPQAPRTAVSQAPVGSAAPRQPVGASNANVARTPSQRSRVGSPPLGTNNQAGRGANTGRLTIKGAGTPPPAGPYVPASVRNGGSGRVLSSANSQVPAAVPFQRSGGTGRPPPGTATALPKSSAASATSGTVRTPPANTATTRPGVPSRSSGSGASSLSR